MLSFEKRTRLMVVLAATVAIAGCGGGSTVSTSERPEPPETTAPPNGSSGGSAATGSEVGEIELDFQRGEVPELPPFSGRMGAGVARDSSYRLMLADGDAIRAPVMADVSPGDRSVVVIATVRAPTELKGRAGVFCRGSADGRTGYELSVGKTGRVRLERVESGKRTLLAGYQARIDAASPPDAPLPVLLICGGRREASEVTFGVTVGVKAVTSFDDPDPLPVPDTARSGLVVSGGSPAAADFAAFKLRFERP